MEVLLLVVLIILILFQRGQNSKIRELHETLKSIQRQLFNLQLKEPVSTKESKVEVKPDKPFTGAPASGFLQSLVQEEPAKEKEQPAEPVEEIKKSSVPESIPQPLKEKENQEAFEKPQEQLISDEELEAMAMADNTAETAAPVPETPHRHALRPEPIPDPSEDWYLKFRMKNPDLEKFIGENILSKVAITILVLGIAFFVKYAIDKDWINEVARVGIGMLAGGVVLGFAHRLRKKFKAFSSVLVAGGISVFYFTIGIGFHEYHVFGQTTAFVLMLLITAFSVFISVAYDRIELAVLSIIGGFATPFMVSTGAGNYQVLFTYILILDIGMLVLAYLRKWNIVNILTYIFTILLYLSWLESKVIDRPDAPYAGALLFGATFYIIFILMNIVNNIKSRRKFAVTEISILLSNTFIYYGCGMQILDQYHPEWKGVFSISMAIVNMIFAWLLYKQFNADTRLVYMLIGLTLTFVTISVPVQLEGNYITLVWALESVLLMWLGLRSGIVLYRFSSVILLFFMLMSLFLDWTIIYRAYYADDIKHMVFINKGFITGFVSALSVLGSVYLLKWEIKRRGDPDHVVSWLNINFHSASYSAGLRILFVCLIYLVGMLELTYQLEERLSLNNAYYIIVMSYHLLFMCVLNLVLPKYRNSELNNVLFYLNAGSVLIFLFGFALLPLYDFRENMTRLETNYTGFIFHYISLVAAVFLAFRAYRFRKTEDGTDPSYQLLYTCLLACAIIYVCSVELLLHIVHLRTGNVYALTTEEFLRISFDYATVQRHVIKAGFPILWGVLAFAFLYFGMKKHYKTFRIAALWLVAVTVLKLFIYDIRNTSEGGKILAFIILGVVLLIISFMYQKIKALIMEGKTDENINSGS